MSSPMIFVLGLLLSLLNATDYPHGHSTRAELTAQDIATLKMVQARVGRRLNDLEPRLEQLEQIAEEAEHDSEGQPIYTPEQAAAVRNIQAVMRQQLEIADEIRLRLNEPIPDEEYEGGFQREVREHRSRVGDHRAGCSGIGKPKINSQDPGVVEGDYRRTGIIVNIQELGKKNGVAEPVGEIKLDHPIGEFQESKLLPVWLSSYMTQDPVTGQAIPLKKMRKGDWVEFTVVQGRSSRAGGKAGRVMAGNVRKIGYMSNQERHTDYWKEYFQGTLVEWDGQSSVGQVTGTPYFKHPTNPKSCYSRSQADGRSRRAPSSERSHPARRPLSVDRAHASGSDEYDSDAAHYQSETEAPGAPGLVRQPAYATGGWRRDAQEAQRQQSQQSQSWNGW